MNQYNKYIYQLIYLEKIMNAFMTRIHEEWKDGKRYA